MPLFIGLGMGVAGAAKSELIDRPAAERKRKLAASTQRYSPWTGMQAQAPTDPDTVAAALSYGSQGAMLGQNIGNAQANQDLLKAQANYYNTNPWALR